MRGSSAQHHESSSEITLLLWMAVIIGGMWLLHRFQPQLMGLQATWLWGHAVVIREISSVPVLGQVVSWLTGHDTSHWNSLVMYLGQSDDPGGGWGASVLHEASRAAGRIVELVAAPVLGLAGLIWWLREQRFSLKVRDTRHMHHLIRRRYSGIPDLSDKPLFEGPWRVPDSVHRYAETHELVGSDGKLDRDRASKVLAGQLGRRFTGYRDLYARPYGWVAKEIVASVPRKHRKAVLRDAANHHRYDSTVLVRLLTTARRFGIVESSRFRMLRGQNRSLWAALGSVGRQSIFVEGLGIVGQYDYERGVFRLRHRLERERAPETIVEQVRLQDEPYMEHTVAEYARALVEVPKDEPWKLDPKIIEDYDWTR